MERIPVESSNVASIGYDLATQTLEVEFKANTIYQYSGVPPSTHDALLASNSKGQYLNAYIKSRYAYTKV